MRRTPVTIGIVVAELAVGALVTAPPAAAGDAPEPAPPVGIEPPVSVGEDQGAEPPAPSEPAPTEPAASLVRSGRAADLPELPVQLPDLPLGDGHEPSVPSPPAPASPTPAPAPGPTSPAPASSPAPSPTPENAAPGASPVPAAGAPPSRAVAPGDSLWEVAASHLAQATGRDRAALGPADIVGYWVRVCAANRERLQSGDLDLIYPGEVIELPPV